MAAKRDTEQKKKESFKKLKAVKGGDNDKGIHVFQQKHRS